ncbi:hypothetical protein [Nostoc sp.]
MYTLWVEVAEVCPLMAQQVNRLASAQQQEVSTYTQILAGLKFKKDLIR